MSDWRDKMGDWRGNIEWQNENDWREDALKYRKSSMTPNMVALGIVVLACIVTFIAVAHVGTLLLSYMDIYADF